MGLNVKAIIIIVVTFLVVFFITRWFHKHFKIPKYGSLVMVNGGVKCGKTTLTVFLGIREYKRRVFATKVANFFNILLNKPKYDLPLIYSNIPLKIDYVPITRDLLSRKKRFEYGSVIIISEAALIADSMLYKDDILNESISLLFKLIAHETRGGVCFCETQSMADNHFGLRRNISSLLYVYQTVKVPLLPFAVSYVREERYSEDSSVMNSYDSDIEDSLKKVLIPTKYWKFFDRYNCSSLTDNLPVEDRIVHGDYLEDLTLKKLVSFRPFKTVPDSFINEDNLEEVTNEET